MCAPSGPGKKLAERPEQAKDGVEGLLDARRRQDVLDALPYRVFEVGEQSERVEGGVEFRDDLVVGNADGLFRP